MELFELAQRLDTFAQQQKTAISQVASDIARLKYDISNQAASPQQAMGVSVERACYNLSLSINNLGDKLKLAAIWAAVILGSSAATILTLMWIILKDAV